ncbi:MAG TPA: hypothetical protein VMV31_08045 [Terriglobales bacterium]|nr:hypothetical protein [Terriglobales bacterium]
MSLWFSTQTAAQILPHLAQVVELLPAEALQRGVRSLSVTALDWSEPALLEERYHTGIPLPAALEPMRPLVQADCACELELAWLLWGYHPDGAAGADEGWRQTPHTLRCSSLGPLFGDGLAAQEGHVVVDFGLDEAFLAELAPWNASTRRHLQANILQLLAFSRKVELQLRPQRRRLWSEGEADWTQRLLRRIAE